MDFRQLNQIAELKYLQSESALKALRLRENTLRAELSRLRSLEQETHRQNSDDAELRAIGGDIIWLKWIAASRRSLNTELAQVLAQKSQLMAKHKKATGQKTAATELLSNAAAKTRADAAAHMLDRAIDANLMRRMLSSPGGRSRQSGRR